MKRILSKMFLLAMFVSVGCCAQAAYVPLSSQEVNSHLKNDGHFELKKGNFLVDGTIIVPAGASLTGAGQGVSVIRMKPNVNQNLVETEGFSQLIGTKNIKRAPANLSIKNLTLDGGYLSSAWNDKNSIVENSKGHCLALYAIRFDIDIEAKNCPQNMIYSEGQGDRSGVEVDSNIRISGTLSGEECIVFRGPGDILLEKAVLGTCGFRPPQLSGNTSYPEYDGVVVEKDKGYEGTLEIGFLHVYGVFNGYGLKTLGNPRFKASQVVSESNRGGVWISKDTWGAISMLDIHANGLCFPSATRTCHPNNPFDAIKIDSLNGFSISQATILKMPNAPSNNPFLRVNGTGSIVKLTLLDKSQVVQTNPYVIASGKNNNITIGGIPLKSDWVVDKGVGNKISYVADAEK